MRDNKMNGFKSALGFNGLEVLHTDNNERDNWELYLNNDSLVLEAKWCFDNQFIWDRSGWVSVTVILNGWDNEYATFDYQIDFNEFGDACRWWEGVIENLTEEEGADSVAVYFFKNLARWGSIAAIEYFHRAVTRVDDEQAETFSQEFLLA